ncbi:MAG: hypothetical protein IT547_19170 [Hyphomonadaceae bacterium]|nr:hypothetical protein [Hyphomonadaceae bacterium]
MKPDDVASAVEFLTELGFKSAQGGATRRFGGGPEVIELIVDLAGDGFSVFAGAIAAYTFCKSNRTVRVNGMEIRGMSAKEVVAILESQKTDDAEDAAGPQ